MKNNILTAILTIGLLWGCRGEDRIIPSIGTDVTGGEKTGDIAGFFLLNEGNMGSNKASLDYFDYQTGTYTKNIYAERNPGVVKELGDVGNDIGIYGDKLYAVINCSHFVEVMDAATAQHISQISIPNCRYITFDGGYAYVSSYAGPVQIDPNSRLGYVARIDTASLAIVDTCIVGYQPEEMSVVDGKLYVANSGGYRAPNYDRTVSVIDLATFKVTKSIDVAINLHRIERDNYGNLYVSSRGDYYNTPAKTYIIDTKTDRVTAELADLPASNMTLCGDSLYVYSAQWSYTTNTQAISYAIFNTRTQSVVTRNFIADGSEKNIKIPYGIAVNPTTGEILITDAKDYVTPGMLHCYDRNGIKKWSVITGDIPAHIVFTTKNLQTINQ